MLFGGQLLFKSKQQGEQDRAKPAVRANKRIKRGGKYDSTFILMVGKGHESESLQAQTSAQVRQASAPLAQDLNAACNEKRICENGKVARNGSK